MDKFPSRSRAATQENAKKAAANKRIKAERRARNNRNARRFFSASGARLLTGGIFAAIMLVFIFTYIIYRIDPAATEATTYWRSYTGSTILGYANIPGHEGETKTLYYFDVFSYLRNFTYAESLDWKNILGVEEWSDVVPENWTVLNALMFLLNLFVFTINVAIFSPLKLLSVIIYYVGLILGLSPQHWLQIASHWIFTDLHVPLIQYFWQ